MAGYLVWVSKYATFDCGGSSLLDCESVLASRWSNWLGVSVSVPAAGVYALIFGALFLVGPKTPPRVQRGAWLVLIPLLTTAVGAALWFVTLLLVIKKFCLYCLLVHGCGLGIAGIVLTRLPTRPANVKDCADLQARGDSRRLGERMLTVRTAWWLGFWGLLGPAMLIAGQLMFPPEHSHVEKLESGSRNGPAAETSKISGFSTSLFDGESLDGWQQVGSGGESWKVEDGLLICTGKRGSWLRSRRKYGDFNLRLEYKLTPAGNSGVYVRVPEDGSHHGQNAGVEIQILDDSHPRYAGLKPYQFSGSVYAVAAAQQRVARPACEWNRLEINCRGRDYRITHNGVVVVDAKAADFPELNQRLSTGYLGLQNHSGKVYFRNLRIGPPQP